MNISSNESPTTPTSSSSRKLRAHWLLTLGLGVALAGCSGEGLSEPDETPGAGGTVGTGGVVGTGGTVATGGTLGSGGIVGSGGMLGTGGTLGGTPGAGGMMPGSGGADPNQMGSGGASDGSGGMADGSGGEAPAGGAPGAGGSSTGGTDGGTCEKGTTEGREVLFIGESFIAASSIPEETSKLAQAAGSLAPNDAYVDKSVSGTWIGNGAGNSIPNQYRDNADGVRFVLMNGGGNDCWQGGQESHRTAALNAASELFQDMGENGVEKVVYFFYPDPIGPQFASLTACLDLLRPEMKALCDAQTAPKCYWVDLRETWDGHPEYTEDGIHVDGPGNAPTAAAIFESMQENCVAP